MDVAVVGSKGPITLSTVWAFSRRSSAVTAKKCTKKGMLRTCRVVVLHIKPVTYLMFSLSSRSSLLKLPINVGRKR